MEDKPKDVASNCDPSNSKDSDQLKDDGHRPKPDSSPTDATRNINRLKEDEQRDGSRPVPIFTPKKSSQMFHYGFRKASFRPKTQKPAWVVESLVDRSNRDRKASLRPKTQKPAWVVESLVDRSDRDRRDSNTQEYQQTSAAAKGKIEMLQKEISDLRKRTADSEQRVESASEIIHELECEKRTMEAKIKELNEQIQELNTRHDSYTQQYQQMSSAAEEKEKLRREITGLQKRITDSDGSSRSALEKVQREKEKLETENQRKNNQIQKLNERQDSQIQEYQKNSAAAAKENERLQREITDLRNHKKDSELTVKSTLERVEVVKGEKAQLKVEIQRQEDQIQDLKIRLAHNKDELDKAKQEKRSETKMREKMESELETFNRKYKVFLKRNRELEEQLKSLIESSDTEAKYLQQRLDEAKEEIRRKEKVTDNLKNLLAGFESDGKILEQENHTLQHEVQKLNTENDNIKKRIRNLEKTASDNRNVHQHYTKQAVEHQRETQKLRQENMRLKAEVHDLQKRCEEAEQVWHDAQHALKENEEKTKQYSSRQESYEQMYQQMSAAEEEKEQLQREITDLKKHIAHLEAEARRYKDQKQELTKRCEEVEQVWHGVWHTLKQNEEKMEKCSPRNHEHDDTIHALRMQSEETEKERDKPKEEHDETYLRHAQAVMDISPREMAMRLGEVYRKIDEMIKRDKAQTDKKDADEEDLSILSDLKELLQKYFTLMEKKYQNNEVINDVLDQEFLEVLPAVRNKFQMFSQSFFEICRDMFSLTPPPRLEFGDGIRGSTINRELFNCYKKPGEVVDYVIWPALVSRYDGSVFEKGIVKPQVLTK